MQGKDLFVARMKRAALWDEICLARDKLIAEGVNTAKAVWDTYKAYGYTSAKEERRLEAEWQKSRPPEERIVDARVGQDEDQARFEAAVGKLPASASPKVELDWIRAHPAMSRQNRQSDQTRRVVITIEDVLKPPCGKAPSQAAVYSLMDWCNYTHEFHVKHLGELRRGGSGETGAKTDSDMAIDEAERHLKRIKDQARSVT